jgi:hypothetical protein
MSQLLIPTNLFLRSARFFPLYIEIVGVHDKDIWNSSKPVAFSKKKSTKLISDVYPSKFVM